MRSRRFYTTASVTWYAAKKILLVWTGTGKGELPIQDVYGSHEFDQGSRHQCSRGSDNSDHVRWDCRDNHELETAVPSVGNSWNGMVTSRWSERFKSVETVEPEMQEHM